MGHIRRLKRAYQKRLAKEAKAAEGYRGSTVPVYGARIARDNATASIHPELRTRADVRAALRLPEPPKPAPPKVVVPAYDPATAIPIDQPLDFGVRPKKPVANGRPPAGQGPKSKKGRRGRRRG